MVDFTRHDHTDCRGQPAWGGRTTGGPTNRSWYGPLHNPWRSDGTGDRQSHGHGWARMKPFHYVAACLVIVAGLAASVLVVPGSSDLGLMYYRSRENDVARALY